MGRACAARRLCAPAAAACITVRGPALVQLRSSGITGPLLPAVEQACCAAPGSVQHRTVSVRHQRLAGRTPMPGGKSALQGWRPALLSRKQCTQLSSAAVIGCSISSALPYHSRAAQLRSGALRTRSAGHFLRCSSASKSQQRKIPPPCRASHVGRVHFAPLTCCFLPSLSLHILHQGLCLAMWSWLKRTLARRAVRSYAQAQLRQAEANVRSAEDTLAKAAGRPSEGARLRACCEQMHAQLRNRAPSSAPDHVTGHGPPQ